MKELVKYHSLLQAKKTLDTRNPAYLYRKLVGEEGREPRYQTRQGFLGNLTYDPLKLELTRKSWRWRVKEQWRELPSSIRGITADMKQFKTELKKYLSKPNICA